MEIIETYETLRKEYKKRSNGQDLPLSNRFHKLLIDAYAIANPKNEKITYTSRNEQTDIYRITFTIKYTVSAGVGYPLNTGAYNESNCFKTA